MDASDEPTGRLSPKTRAILAWVLLGLGALILLVGSLTVWVKRQALDTDAWSIRARSCSRTTRSGRRCRSTSSTSSTRTWTSRAGSSSGCHRISTGSPGRSPARCASLCSGPSTGSSSDRACRISGKASTARRTRRCCECSRTRRGRVSRPPRARWRSTSALRRPRRRGARLRRAARRPTPGRRGPDHGARVGRARCRAGRREADQGSELDRRLAGPRRVRGRGLARTAPPRDAAGRRGRLPTRRNPPPDHPQHRRLVPGGRARGGRAGPEGGGVVVDHRHEPARGGRLGLDRLRSRRADRHSARRSVRRRAPRSRRNRADAP